MEKITGSSDKKKSTVDPRTVATNRWEGHKTATAKAVDVGQFVKTKDFEFTGKDKISSAVNELKENKVSE